MASFEAHGRDSFGIGTRSRMILAMILTPLRLMLGEYRTLTAAFTVSLTPRKKHWNICEPNMTKAAKEFLKSTTLKMDEMLAALTPEEQHDLLDALAGEVEERLDQVMDQDGRN